jgi:tetratricopeptide (TPR) repeat protein
MKLAATITIVLAITGFVVAQQKPGSQPAGQSGAAQPGANAGAAQGANPAQTPAETPQGKHPPQAKTQPEFDAYKAAMANANDPAAMEKAATDFASKFPDSELRVLLFKAAMRGYQGANDGEKMMEMGRDVLKIDPDDPEALVGVSEVLAERTRDTDLDKGQRLDEALKLAQHALETVDTDVMAPAGTPPEKIQEYKDFLRSSAYSIIGTLQFNQDKYPEAEAAFRKSIDALPSQPDPVAVLRLAVSLDKQNKYPEALKYAEQAVQLTKEGTNVGTAARNERSRLQQLTGGSAAPAKPPAGAPNGEAPKQ